MATQEGIIITIEENGFEASGIFKEGIQELRDSKPLIVLLHGGGTNATYFDNKFHSLVLDTSEQNLVKIFAPGYHPDSIPKASMS